MDINRCLAVLVCFVLVGCSPPRVYQLAVSPDGDAMRRELVVINGGGVEDMLGTIFPVPVIKDGVSRYSGSFDTVPADIGGSGTWQRVTSPMGSVYFYAERFRGDDDLVGQVEARLLATDRMVDLLIAWFESELNDDAGWPVLREFMDTQLRHDMKNLSLYIFELDRQGQEVEQWVPACLARVGQYFVDRGYFSDGDLYALVSLFNSGKPASAGESADGLLQRVAARRMGLEEGAGIPDALGFLRMSDGIEPSWEAFRSLPAYVELVGGWGRHEADESLEAGDLDGAVSSTMLAAMGAEFEIFSSPDEVLLALDCGTEPVATNGEWDDEAKRVTWGGQVRERYGLPLFFYAYWAEADTEYQDAHFGGTIFQDGPLLKMVAWYTGLSAESQAKWDGFVGSLDVSASIRDQVEAFGDANELGGVDSLEWGCTHLLNALPVEPE